MDSGFRQLDTRERALLEKLLDAEFLGRDELHAQLDSLTAKQIEEDGTLTLRCASGPPSPSKYRLAMEGWYKDVDGMAISVMLHLDKDGFMSMLEIIKYGGSPIIDPPSARALVLLLPEERGRKPGEEIP
ncbi:MAG TPA: hypothetical protein VE957_15910 [Terriglobales bacterium]|jgi:hypothetical protein|nr:hypothetical protein [Terriglobales bacterium]